MPVPPNVDVARNRSNAITDSAHGSLKAETTPILKGEGFFSKMWSAIKLGTSALVGIPLAFAASCAIIPLMGLSKGLDMLHTHARKIQASGTSYIHNKNLQAFHDWTTGLFSSVWGWAASPYVRPVTSILSTYEESRGLPHPEQVSQHTDVTFARGRHGAPGNDVLDPIGEPLDDDHEHGRLM